MDSMVMNLESGLWGYYNWLSGELIERLNLECVVEFWWRHRVRNDYAILLSIFCFHVYLFIFTGGESTRNMCIIFACYCQDDCEEIINIEEFFTFTRKAVCVLCIFIVEIEHRVCCDCGCKSIPA